MRSSLRLLFVSGAISYRALFNWTTPQMFVGTLLAAPVTQLLFFVYLGRQLGVADDKFFIIGNAVLAASIAGVFGGTMALANERYFGTLGNVLLSFRSRTLLFLGRALPYALNGLLVAAFTLAVGMALFGLRLPLPTLALLLVALCSGALSCSFFGLALGAIGLRFRDIFLIANVAHTLLILFTGAEVPLRVLPGWMQAISHGVPMTHSIEAARRIGAGAGFADVAALLGYEAIIAAAFAAAAAILLRVFEREGRREGSFDVT